LLRRIDYPQLVANLEVVGDVDERGARGHVNAQPLEFRRRSRIQAEDRTGVGTNRGKQLQAIFLGCGKGLFVRKNAARRELFEPKAHDETIARKAPPLDFE